jgi:hypothetical protein
MGHEAKGLRGSPAEEADAPMLEVEREKLKHASKQKKYGDERRLLVADVVQS